MFGFGFEEAEESQREIKIGKSSAKSIQSKSNKCDEFKTFKVKFLPTLHVTQPILFYSSLVWFALEPTMVHDACLLLCFHSIFNLFTSFFFQFFFRVNYPDLKNQTVKFS